MCLSFGIKTDRIRACSASGIEPFYIVTLLKIYRSHRIFSTQKSVFKVYITDRNTCSSTFSHIKKQSTFTQIFGEQRRFELSF